MNPQMSQQILSRLYTDEVYRNQFLRGKEKFYDTHQITDPDAIAFLDAIKPRQLEFFTKGLYAKRYHEVLHLMPGTAHLMKDSIGKLFRQFSQTPVHYGVHRHHEETLAFMDFIKSRKCASPEAEAVLKFERTVIRNFLKPKAWRLCRLDYNVPGFLTGLHTGNIAPIQNKRQVVLFKNGKLVKVIRFLY